MKHPLGNQDKAPKEAVHFCMLPHEVFFTMGNTSPELFEYLFTGGASNLQSWWGKAALAAKEFPTRSGPWLRAARLATDNADPACVVPLGMHGDDAGGHGHEKVLVVTWGSVAVDLSTLDSRICFTMLRDSEAVAGVTREKFYKVLTWSFAALAAGVFPACDEEGKGFGPEHHPGRASLAGRPLHHAFRGVWAEMRGDWKFLKEALHLKHGYHARKCCHLCDAEKDVDSSTDFTLTADVRATCTETAAWMASDAHAGTSPLLRLPAFDIWRVQFDIMHTLDLGILQLAIPSALQELTSAGGLFEGRTRECRVKAASAAYDYWCRKNKVQCRCKRITMQWVLGPRPKISQAHCKAAPLRRMVQWIMEACQEAAAREADLHARRRAAFFVCLHHADCTMRANGRCLGCAAAAAISRALRDALVLYKALRDGA